MNPYRKDFPILKKRINGKPLVYVDNAATAQKPKEVLDAINGFYTGYNANIQRGIHTMSQQATEIVEYARATVAKLIGAESPSEIVFSYGATYGINFIAYAWAERTLTSGDEIILSFMEHHSNTVPWLELAKRKRIKLKFVPVTKKFELDYDALKKLVTRKTKLISLVHISNVLGTVNDIPEIVRIAKRVGAKVLIDAAQSVSRTKIDVVRQGIDFLAFSGHKMYAPTGSGALYIKKKLIKTMPPFLSGGGMIIEVTHKSVIFQAPPEGLEAGTINIEGAIGLGAAASYLLKKGISTVERSEREVSRYAYKRLKETEGVTLFCHRDPHGVLSFNVAGVHPHDVGEILNRHGVAIRTGNHCTMPLHRAFGLTASARISLACYNTKEEIDTIIRALKDVKRTFNVSSLQTRATTRVKQSR